MQRAFFLDKHEDCIVGHRSGDVFVHQQLAQKHSHASERTLTSDSRLGVVSDAQTQAAHKSIARLHMFFDV